uniref:Uncharacterized protein n=1 Tax=viral metagenome TaxID=1070528 RepID=A0A6C0H7T9_9ZZZZ
MYNNSIYQNGVNFWFNQINNNKTYIYTTKENIYYDKSFINVLLIWIKYYTELHEKYNKYSKNDNFYKGFYEGLLETTNYTIRGRLINSTKNNRHIYYYFYIMSNEKIDEEILYIYNKDYNFEVQEMVLCNSYYKPQYKSYNVSRNILGLNIL